MIRFLFILFLTYCLMFLLLGCGGGGGGGGGVSASPDELSNEGPVAVAPARMEVVATVPGVATAQAPSGLNNYSVQFSASLDPESIQTNSVEVRVNNSPWPGRWETKAHTLLFHPQEKIPGNAQVRVRVKSGLRNEFGQVLDRPFELEFQTPLESNLDLFEVVPESRWNSYAVQRVLQTFAFGSQATQEQISTWASMDPREAIVEMMNFAPINPKLSPPGKSAILPQGATLEELQSFLVSNRSPLEAKRRNSFETGKHYALQNSFLFSVTQKGGNPFLHRIAFFESNYHLAVNESAGVKREVLQKYYDQIVKDLSSDVPYQKLLANAASSHAVAIQYNHIKNRFVDGQFKGNEDFAREFHQLFFGILGESDPNFPQFLSYETYKAHYGIYHELITIRNTAKALTGMKVTDGVVSFGSQEHHVNDLEILGVRISGNTMREKINALSEISIENHESLQNLPILLIKGLADDEVDDAEAVHIRNAWKAMQEKNLLRFLRSYAISNVFHSSTREKLWSSFERNIMFFNQIQNEDLERLYSFSRLHSNLKSEGVESFRPAHNVFGHQTGLEAFTSPAVFQAAHEAAVQDQWNRIRSDGSYNNQRWERDWSKVLPRDARGFFQVKDAAEWLFEKMHSRPSTEFKKLERAQVYALMNAGVSFEQIAYPEDPQRIVQESDFDSNQTVIQAYTDLENGILSNLINEGEDNWKYRKQDNWRVGMTAIFLSMLPEYFLQRGLE